MQISPADIIENERSGEIGGYVIDGKAHCVKHAAQYYGPFVLSELIDRERAVIIHVNGEAICVSCKARI